MLAQHENESLTRVGPGTPMGALMRRYWIPASFSQHIPRPDCPPVRVRLLGENLVLFQADGRFRGGRVDPDVRHPRRGRDRAHWINDDISSEQTDLQTVARRDIEEMVGCPHAPCARHVSDDDVWVA